MFIWLDMAGINELKKDIWGKTEKMWFCIGYMMTLGSMPILLRIMLWLYVRKCLLKDVMISMVYFKMFQEKIKIKILTIVKSMWWLYSIHYIILLFLVCLKFFIVKDKKKRKRKERREKEGEGGRENKDKKRRKQAFIVGKEFWRGFAKEIQEVSLG